MRPVRGELIPRRERRDSDHDKTEEGEADDTEHALLMDRERVHAGHPPVCSAVRFRPLTGSDDTIGCASASPIAAAAIAASARRRISAGLPTTEKPMLNPTEQIGEPSE